MLHCFRGPAQCLKLVQYLRGLAMLATCQFLPVGAAACDGLVTVYPGAQSDREHGPVPKFVLLFEGAPPLANGSYIKVCIDPSMLTAWRAAVQPHTLRLGGQPVLFQPLKHLQHRFSYHACCLCCGVVCDCMSLMDMLCVQWEIH